MSFDSLEASQDDFNAGYEAGKQKAIKRIKRRALHNFRKICNCYHKGVCVVDAKRCTFKRCETLKDLFG